MIDSSSFTRASIIPCSFFAAFNPSGSVAWVRVGILYGLVVLVFEIVSAIHGKGFHLGPVIFGLAFSLLLIATYPERRKLLPSASETGSEKAPVTPSAEAGIKPPAAQEPETEPKA